MKWELFAGKELEEGELTLSIGVRKHGTTVSMKVILVRRGGLKLPFSILIWEFGELAV